MDGIALTEQFLAHIFAGRMEEALAMVSPQARFIGSRPEFSDENPLFGTHVGPEGALAFFAAFAELLDPGTFEVTGKFGTQEEACLFGTLRHHVRATGKPFASDWALVTGVRDGQLTLYHFYEDTAALAQAMRAD